jgi:hypothetical protein
MEHLDPAVFTCLACKNACFHLACIQSWASHASTCPLCRAELPAAVLPPKRPTQQTLHAVDYILADDDDGIHGALSIQTGRQELVPAASVAAPAAAHGAPAGPLAGLDAELCAVARVADIHRLLRVAGSPLPPHPA